MQAQYLIVAAHLLVLAAFVVRAGKARRGDVMLMSAVVLILAVSSVGMSVSA